MLSAKELIIIDRISENSGNVSQRQLAQNSNLSLGLTNIILKKLARTGYIKISQLTPKKVCYMLTRKGMVEKAEKSYNYVCKTINEMKRIEQAVHDLLLQEVSNGNKSFGVLGSNGLVELVELCAKGIDNVNILKIDDKVSSRNLEGIDIIIDCRGKTLTDNTYKVKKLDLVSYISAIK